MIKNSQYYLWNLENENKRKFILGKAKGRSFIKSIETFKNQEGRLLYM